MAGADPNLNPLNPNLVPLPDEVGDLEQDLEQLSSSYRTAIRSFGPAAWATGRPCCCGAPCSTPSSAR